MRKITSLFCGDPVNPSLLLLGICSTPGYCNEFLTGEEAHPDVRKFCTALILGLIYSAAIGGMSMLIGTGVNLILVGMWESYFHSENPISFSSWFFFGFPVNPSHLLLGICSTPGYCNEFLTGEEAHPDVRKFCTAVILGLIYSAAIGGMSMLIGTDVNLILMGMWESYFHSENPISFSSWFFFGFPLALHIFFSLWGILCLFYCSKGSSEVLSSYLDRAHLRRELELLKPMAFAEKMILAVFGVLVLLWMTRSLTNVPGWGALFDGRVGDGSVSNEVNFISGVVNAWLEISFKQSHQFQYDTASIHPLLSCSKQSHQFQNLFLILYNVV